MDAKSEKMDAGLAEALDECLGRVLGGEDIERCLGRYPQWAAQLEPLIVTALAMHQASQVEPRPEFKAAAHYRLQTALRRLECGSEGPAWYARWRWAFVSAVVAILLAASGGTVAASAYSLPGELLYPVKLTSEQVGLWLTPSETGRAQLQAQFADRRIGEIARMAEAGDYQHVAEAAELLTHHMESIEVVATSPAISAASGAASDDMAELRRRVNQQAPAHLELLKNLEEEIPGLGPELKQAQDSYEAVLQALELEQVEPEQGQWQGGVEKQDIEAERQGSWAE